MSSYKQYLEYSNEKISKMTHSELVKATKTMRDAANKRIKRVEAAGLYTPVRNPILGTSGAITAPEKKTDFEYRQQMRALKKFLATKNTTVRGARKLEADIVAKFNLPDTMTNSEKSDFLKDFFKAYRSVYDNATDFAKYGYGSQQVINEAMEKSVYTPKTPDEWRSVFTEIQERYRKRNEDAFSWDKSEMLDWFSP